MTQSPQAGSDAQDDQTGRFVVQPNGRPRPLSPHMQIWRWHITMAASILFRATIGAASFAAVIVVGWLAALACGPQAYTGFLTVAASPFGLFIGMGLTLVLFSFLLNGGRHLINDTGNGLSVKTSNLLSHIAVWGPIALTVVFWIVLFASGRIAL
jgi:succinate dehydrogenase / fumarate reductase cytochrome b subunit